MKYFSTTLAANAVAICFILLAALFVYLERDGWGWCLLCALLTTCSVSIGSKDEN